MYGKRIFYQRKRPSLDLIEKYQKVVTPHISDNLARLWGATTKLRPLHGKAKLVGAALTVKTRPGDNLIIHKALDMLEANDVLVVDAGGELKNAVFGEIMMTIAQQKQAAGIIINGAIRDVAAFQEANYPIYAKGVTHLGPYKDGPGEINVPVEMDSMIIEPGDLIVGDEDGLVVVPLSEAETLLDKIASYQADEEKQIAEIKAGTVDRSWVDQALKAKGYTYYK